VAAGMIPIKGDSSRHFSGINLRFRCDLYQCSDNRKLDLTLHPNEPICIYGGVCNLPSDPSDGTKNSGSPVDEIFNKVLEKLHLKSIFDSGYHSKIDDFFKSPTDQVPDLPPAIDEHFKNFDNLDDAIYITKGVVGHCFGFDEVLKPHFSAFKKCPKDEPNPNPTPLPRTPVPTGPVQKSDCQTRNKAEIDRVNAFNKAEADRVNAHNQADPLHPEAPHPEVPNLEPCF
jgi:hypothetical protein